MVPDFGHLMKDSFVIENLFPTIKSLTKNSNQPNLGKMQRVWSFNKRQLMGLLKKTRNGTARQEKILF